MAEEDKDAGPWPRFVTERPRFEDALGWAYGWETQKENRLLETAAAACFKAFLALLRHSINGSLVCKLESRQYLIFGSFFAVVRAGSVFNFNFYLLLFSLSRQWRLYFLNNLHLHLM
jgi:hypothetical protein